MPKRKRFEKWLGVVRVWTSFCRSFGIPLFFLSCGICLSVWYLAAVSKISLFQLQQNFGYEEQVSKILRLSEDGLIPTQLFEKLEYRHSFQFFSRPRLGNHRLKFVAHQGEKTQVQAIAPDDPIFFSKWKIKRRMLQHIRWGVWYEFGPLYLYLNRFCEHLKKAQEKAQENIQKNIQKNAPENLQRNAGFSPAQSVQVSAYRFTDWSRDLELIDGLRSEVKIWDGQCP